jgi:glycosyltransferase involved in cell wall biosynthesis
LILASRFPFPLEKGDKLRLFEQIKVLSQYHNIFLFCINETKVTPQQLHKLTPFTKDIHIEVQSKEQAFWQTFRSLFSRIPFQVGYFYNKGVKQIVQSKVNDWKIDEVYCQLIRMAPYCIDLKIHKSIDFMDAMSFGIKNRINKEKGIKKWLYDWEYRRTKNYEKFCTQQFDRKYIISERDKKVLDDSNILVVPNGVDYQFFKKNTEIEKKYQITFVGNMQYPPNIDAALYLAKKILPLLGSDIKILIAGANPVKSIKELNAHPQIEVSGWLNDIRMAYWQSEILVAPLFSGAGLQNKILEAMACEIPCITTTIVNESLQAKNNSEILLANTPQEFHKHITSLLKDKNQSLSINARKYVEQNYSWQKNTEILLD